MTPSHVRERLAKLRATYKSKTPKSEHVAAFAVWYVKRTMPTVSDAELEILLAQFKMEVTE